MLTPGEGAVSTGAMVPVFAAQDSGSATQVVEILEAHAIPAILDSEISVAATWGPSDDRPKVLVPSTMLPAAKAILQKHTEPAATTTTKLAALSTWRPAKVDSTPVPTPSGPVPAVVPPMVAPRPVEPPAQAWDDDDDLEDEGPVAEYLPDPGPTGPRVTLALACIAFGLIFQRSFEMILAGRATVLTFGATAESVVAPWKLVTAGFLHGGVSHMVSNALFGLLIGVVLFGTHRIGATALVWVIASVTGIAAELSMSPNTVVFGASAGNYGLVGLWACGQLQRARRAPLPSRERVKTLGVLLLLLPGALTPFSSTGTRIAVFAHAIGFVAGFLLGLYFTRRLDDETPRLDARSRLAGGVAASVVLAAFATSLVGVFT